RRTGSFPLLVMISAVLLRGIALPTLLALSLRLRAWPLQHLLRSGALRPLHHLPQVRALRLLCLRLMPLGLPPLQRLPRVLGLRLSALAVPALRRQPLSRRALPLQDVSARLGQGVSSLERLLGSRSRALCRQAMTLRQQA